MIYKYYRSAIFLSLMLLGFFFWPNLPQAQAAIIDGSEDGFYCEISSGNSIAVCTVHSWPVGNGGVEFYQIKQADVYRTAQYVRYGSHFGAGRVRVTICLATAAGVMYESGAPCYMIFPDTQLPNDNGIINFDAGGLPINANSSHKYTYLNMEVALTSAGLTITGGNKNLNNAYVEGQRVSINSFSVDYNNVTVGQPFNLSWDETETTDNAQLLYDLPAGSSIGGTPVSGSGSMSVPVSSPGVQVIAGGPGTASFTLKATGYGINVACGSNCLLDNPGGAITISTNDPNPDWGGYPIPPPDISVTITASAVAPTCSPASQTVFRRDWVTFNGAGGNGTYTWSAPGADGNVTVLSGPGNNQMATQYASTGDYIVTVTSNGQTADCAVTIDPPPVGTSGLSIIKNGNGTGTVASAPSGIDCGIDCSGTFTNGNDVILNAAPDAGSIITGWSGGGCSGTGTSCTVTLASDTTVTVTFTDSSSNLPTLTMSANPPSVPYNGSSTISWTSTNATTCDVSSHSGTSSNFDTGNLIATTTYYGTCTGPNGTSPQANVTVIVGAPPVNTISFTITYTPKTLNVPQNVTVDNTVCSKITVNWTYVSNGAEDGFYVYRSTDNSSWALVSPLLGAGIRTYQDTPPTVNQVYYYMVHAHRALVINPRESLDSNSASAMDIECKANLSASSKILYSVNGVAYTSATKIKSGDTLGFRISIFNSGPSNATIQYICDYPSSNLNNMTSMNATGAGMINTGFTFPDPTCDDMYQLHISGVKNLVNNWTVNFSMTFTPTISQATQQVITNTATIYYTDPSGAHQQVITMLPILVSTDNAKPPTFQEVAP